MQDTIDNLSLIVAMTHNRVIGKAGKIPWHIPGDLKLFRQHTEGNTVIMGRNTYQSILEALGHPLEKRDNIVVSSSLPDTEGIIVAKTLEDALEKAQELGKPIFSIGGASIYEQTLPLARQLYISYIKDDYEGDTFFPEFNIKDYILLEYQKYQDFEFYRYRKEDSA